MKYKALIKFAIVFFAIPLSQMQLSHAHGHDDHSASAKKGLEAIQATMTVYKTPSCGCCQKWVSHIEGNDFATKVVEMNDLSSVKSKYGIGSRYQSCHTGVVVGEAGEYVFEGHVPAEHVQAFLNNPPKGAIGLSVPGMPIGSPGMEVGDRMDYYQVLQLNLDGSSSIYAHVNQVD